MALPDPLTTLLDAATYPHQCSNILLIETHISWILLTGTYAYKLKKPVRFNFVDFSTLALREHFCREELRCNRAFAPDLYLDVVALVRTEEGLAWQQEPEGEVLEWAVQMRQFDPEQALDRVLERGQLTEAELHRFGMALAERHAQCPRLSGTPEEVPVRIFGPVEDNFSEIERTDIARVAGCSEEAGRALASARRLGSALRADFNARMTSGSVRECHGDLHLSNLARIGGEVTAFDCLEFNENLRWIDTMSDVAFLFMDCHYRGESKLAYAFLDGYLDRSGDYRGAALFNYFAAYRSVVRAKVAALRWSQDGGEGSLATFRGHLLWALDRLERPPGGLLITCGLSASGKSYLAGRLAVRLPAIRLRSDVARKVLAGLEALDDSGSGIDSGLYGSDQSDRTFDFLASVAIRLIEAGEWVIVDATFIERARRDQFRELAMTLKVPMVVLHCEAPDNVLQERLVERGRAQGGRSDPSEATPEVLELQKQRFEPPGEDETIIRVDTGVTLTEVALEDLLARISACRANPEADAATRRS